MLAVTCFQCGHAVEISPDADRCAACGANLRRLISAQQASRYFYMRAADLSARGETVAALAEIQRGLAYQPSSELHLLGAILCKRLGKVEEMRHHVAAIPVDDVLRGEAEWLLRSSQARQRAPVDPRRAQEEVPLSDAELLPVTLDEVRPAPALRRSRLPGLVTMLGLLLLLALGGWWVWSAPPAWLADLLPAAGLTGPITGEEPPVALPAASPVQAIATEEQPLQEAAAEEAAATATPAPIATLPPTPAVAPDLAQQSEPLAAASPQALIVSPPFDLKTVLIEAQRPELAATVTGRREGNVLIIEGTAPSVEARDDLAALLARLPGIEEVSVVNVLVRPPATYTVVEGDSLWGISMKLYGNPDRVQALFEANQETLPSADALRVGMVLQVPPVE